MNNVIQMLSAIGRGDRIASQKLAKPLGKKIAPTQYVCKDPDTLPRREWIYGTFLIRRELSATYAPGGVGKTSLLSVEAIALSSGKPLLGMAVKRPLRTWLWSGEEPEDELIRRIEAVRKHYELTEIDLDGRLFVDNGFGVPLVVTNRAREGATIAVPVVDALVEALIERRIDVMLIDPFVSTHDGPENDTGAMQAAATAWKEVAYRANVAISLAHHTRKLNGQEATVDDQRGSSALRDKCRQNRVLNPMSSKDAGDLGITDEERFGFFSTGPSEKNNMTARTGRKAWYRTIGVHVGLREGNLDLGDSVGVVTAWEPPSIKRELAADHIEALGGIMARQPSWRAAPQSDNSPDWIGVAVADAFEIDQSEGGWKREAKAIIKRLEGKGILSRGKILNEHRKPVVVSIFNSPQSITSEDFSRKDIFA